MWNQQDDKVTNLASLIAQWWGRINRKTVKYVKQLLSANLLRGVEQRNCVCIEYAQVCSMHYLHQRKEMGSLWGGPFFTPRSYFAAVGDIGGAKGNNHANRIFCRRGYKPRQLYMLVKFWKWVVVYVCREFPPALGKHTTKNAKVCSPILGLASWWWITL